MARAAGAVGGLVFTAVVCKFLQVEESPVKDLTADSRQLVRVRAAVGLAPLAQRQQVTSAAPVAQVQLRTLPDLALLGAVAAVEAPSLLAALAVLAGAALVSRPAPQGQGPLILAAAAAVQVLAALQVRVAQESLL